MLYYVIGLVVVAGCGTTTILAYMAAARLAAISIRRRPRWLYGLYAIGYSLPVVIFVRIAIDHVRAHSQNQGGWAPVAGGLVATVCTLAALLMLGRALARGRKRRALWLFPPQWLDHELLSREPVDPELIERT